MNEDSERTEEILAALLAGDLEVDAPEVRELFEREPQVRERWESLRGLAGRLSDAGEEQRSDIADASRRRGSPGEQHVVEAVTGRRRAEVTRGAPRWWRPLLVAALVLVAVWAVVSSGDGETDPVVVLGPSAGERYPVGEVREYIGFSWDLVLPPGGWFVVRVFDDRTPGGALLIESSELQTKAWTRDPDQTAAWPDRIRWEVTAFDALGEVVGSDTGRASRSSP